MGRAIGVLLLVALGCGVVWAQGSPEEVLIQSRIEKWTFWMMMTGALSAGAAFLSAILLVWTFNEQRKLTQNAERAWLRIEESTGWIEQDRILISFGFENVGKTAALNVRIVGKVIMEEQRRKDYVRLPNGTLSRTPGRPLDPKWGPGLLTTGQGQTAPPGQKTWCTAETTLLHPGDAAAFRAADKLSRPCFNGALEYQDVHGRKHLHPIAAVIVVQDDGKLSLLM